MLICILIVFIMEFLIVVNVWRLERRLTDLSFFLGDFLFSLENIYTT